jgi:hypothetical protein
MRLTDTADLFNTTYRLYKPNCGASLSGIATHTVSYPKHAFKPLDVLLRGNCPLTPTTRSLAI